MIQALILLLSLSSQAFASSGSYTPSGSSAGLTDTQLRATAVPMSVSSLPLPSGASTSANQTSELTKLDTLHTDVTTSQLRACTKSGTWAIDSIVGTVTVNGSVSVSNFPASQAVTNAGTFAVQAALNAETTKVIGTVNVAASQTIAVTQATAASLNATVVLAAGSAKVGQVAIDQTTPGTTNLVQVGGSLPAGANLLGAVTLGNLTSKTNVNKTGSLTSSATTADQVALTYTVTTGKTLYLQYLDMEARLTAVSVTGVILGACSLETPSGTKVITHTFTNPTTEAVDRVVTHDFAEPIPIAAAVVVRVVCTPAAATSTLWIANFGGYEK